METSSVETYISSSTDLYFDKHRSHWAHFTVNEAIHRATSYAVGTQLPSPKKGQSPQFLAHVYCGQTAGWIKTPLGMEVDLGPS